MSSAFRRCGPFEMTRVGPIRTEPGHLADRERPFGVVWAVTRCVGARIARPPRGDRHPNQSAGDRCGANDTRLRTLMCKSLLFATSERQSASDLFGFGVALCTV